MDVLCNGAGPLSREGEVACAVLDIWWLPVGAPVAVGVEEPFAVLVVAAVAVVVDALLAQKGPFPFLAGLHGNHQPRILGVGTVIAQGVADPHLADVAVVVEIIGSVLIDESVAIVVFGHAQTPARIRRVGLLKKTRPPVDVHHRKDVVRIPVDHLFDFLVFPVAGKQQVGIIEAHLPGLNFVAVDVAVDIHPRFGEGFPGAVVVDGQRPDLPVLFAAAHQVEPRELRVRLVQCLQRFGHLVVIIIAVKAQRHLNFALRLRKNRQRKGQKQYRGD